jgi:hypothetical protein
MNGEIEDYASRYGGQDPRDAPRRGQTVECGPGTGMGLESEGANSLRLVECATERERERGGF